MCHWLDLLFDFYVGTSTPLPGIRLNLAVSLHNQGVLEQEHVCLVRLEAEELISPLQDIQPFTSCSGAEVGTMTGSIDQVTNLVCL